MLFSPNESEVLLLIPVHYLGGKYDLHYFPGIELCVHLVKVQYVKQQLDLDNICLSFK